MRVNSKKKSFLRSKEEGRGSKLISTDVQSLDRVNNPFLGGLDDIH
jgi:hypothetical protein